MNVNARQEALQLELPKAVACVGLGGVGSWCAYFLALAGVKTLWLFDSDEISDHNLNRIPLPMSAVGKKKTEALAELIHSVRPECNTLCMGAFTELVVDACDLSSEVDYVVVSTDTLISRQTIYGWASRKGVSYIEASAEGEMGSCTGAPAEWSTPQESLPGYASVPVWVGPCVFSAAVAVAHIIHGGFIGDRAIRMGWERTQGKYGPEEQFSMFDSQLAEEDNVEDVSEAEKKAMETEGAV